jgi:hypothetical protein
MRLVVLLTSVGLLCACAGSPPPDAATVKDDYARRGYRPALVHGELLYCRSESVTGTQFPSAVCVSEQQIKDADAKTRDTTRSRAMHPNLQCHNQDCAG